MSNKGALPLKDGATGWQPRKLHLFVWLALLVRENSTPPVLHQTFYHACEPVTRCVEGYKGSFRMQELPMTLARSTLTTKHI